MKDTLISKERVSERYRDDWSECCYRQALGFSAFSEVVETSGEKCRLAIIGPGSREDVF